MQKIKKGDTVIVTVGKDKGRKGTVNQVISKVIKARSRTLQKSKVIVEGINLVKRHTKPNPGLQKAGGILEKEAPIDISNVAIFNSATGKADRVGFKLLENGQKVRVFKSTSERVDV